MNSTGTYIRQLMRFFANRHVGAQNDTRRTCGVLHFIILRNHECDDEGSHIPHTIPAATDKRSNQLWHVGGVGTFRTSIIVNKKLRLGVVVLGNAKGRASANAHYIAKMLYSELKSKRINLHNVLKEN